jgi:hypothetical protein
VRVAAAAIVLAALDFTRICIRCDDKSERGSDGLVWFSATFFRATIHAILHDDTDPLRTFYPGTSGTYTLLAKP